MDEMVDHLVINYNPFEDIAHNRPTIWRCDVFEQSLPALITAGSERTPIGDSSATTAADPSLWPSMRSWMESMDDLDSYPVLQPIVATADESMGQRWDGSGDCAHLWPVAAVGAVDHTKTRPKSGVRRAKERSAVNNVRFPDKLWQLVGECTSGAIRWSPNGDSIQIDYHLFQKQYLNNCQHFKTRNVCSFVRQLNLYGFYKISKNCKRKPNTGSVLRTIDTNRPEEQEIHEFKNEFFRRDHQNWLPMVYRRYSVKTVNNDENCEQLSDKCMRKALKQLAKDGNNTSTATTGQTKAKPRAYRRYKSSKMSAESPVPSKTPVLSQSADCFSYYSHELIFNNNLHKAFALSPETDVSMSPNSVNSVTNHFQC